MPIKCQLNNTVEHFTTKKPHMKFTALSKILLENSQPFRSYSHQKKRFFRLWNLEKWGNFFFGFLRMLYRTRIGMINNNTLCLLCLRRRHIITKAIRCTRVNSASEENTEQTEKKNSHTYTHIHTPCTRHNWQKGTFYRKANYICLWELRSRKSEKPY